MLEKINKPNDIHKIALADFPQLADEIRQFLIESVSQTGGHLASNLGVVELTLALHNVLDLPQDKIVWDVGHQAYTHKILTGRKEEFKNLRKEGGMKGQIFSLYIRISDPLTSSATPGSPAFALFWQYR